MTQGSYVAVVRKRLVRTINIGDSLDFVILFCKILFLERHQLITFSLISLPLDGRYNCENLLFSWSQIWYSWRYDRTV